MMCACTCRYGRRLLLNLRGMLWIVRDICHDCAPNQTHVRHAPLFLTACCHNRARACWAYTATMSCWAAQAQSARRGIVPSRSMLPSWDWKTCLEARL